jgi:hypothetical protein
VNLKFTRDGPVTLPVAAVGARGTPIRKGPCSELTSGKVGLDVTIHWHIMIQTHTHARTL